MRWPRFIKADRPPLAAHRQASSLAEDEGALGAMRARDIAPPAPKNQASAASRGFVICDRADVVGYTSLSAGAIDHAASRKPMSTASPPGEPERKNAMTTPVLVASDCA